MNEVYVIHRNGRMYEHPGRKIAYLTKGAAKQVITSEAKKIAQYNFEDADHYHNYWHDLTKREKDELIEKAKEEFEVVTYVPKTKY